MVALATSYTKAPLAPMFRHLCPRWACVRRRRRCRFDTSAHVEHVQGAVGADVQAPLLTLSTCLALWAPSLCHLCSRWACVRRRRRHRSDPSAHVEHVLGAAGAVASTPLLALSTDLATLAPSFDTSAHVEHVQGAAGLRCSSTSDHGEHVLGAVGAVARLRHLCSR